jgi:hypothetical protein
MRAKIISHGQLLLADENKYVFFRKGKLFFAKSIQETPRFLCRIPQSGLKKLLCNIPLAERMLRLAPRTAAWIDDHSFLIAHRGIVYRIELENGEITQEEALELGMEPIREFMYGETQVKDVQMFMEIARLDWDGELESIPTSVLIPSFMVSELRTAFFIGFIIYIPFIVIDMVVASALMSMGMMMLPPTTVSLPFKILLFVLADGWSLVIGSLVKTFYH